MPTDPPGAHPLRGEDVHSERYTVLVNQVADVLQKRPDGDPSEFSALTDPRQIRPRCYVEERGFAVDLAQRVIDDLVSAGRLSID